MATEVKDYDLNLSVPRYYGPPLVTTTSLLYKRPTAITFVHFQLPNNNAITPEKLLHDCFLRLVPPSLYVPSRNAHE